MRLHTLGITAFGPFAQAVEVNFDELSEAGLFLLSGATGAGKTSVLDAVCFALYGEVPGDRNTAKRLRADQASEGVRPRVVLEATISSRRLRITRSPAWQRPKRRGHGITTEQSSVVVQEWVDDAWITRTTRADEAGHFVSGLLRMTLTQFCQVALLPQGRFQSFLRARSEERQQLLQQLFRTQRFADIESWLGDHRRQLRRESAAIQSSVTGVLNRLSEVALVDEPPDLEPDIHTLTDVERWAADVTQRLRDQADVAQQRRDAARSNAAAALRAHAEATECHRLRNEYRDATHEARVLDQDLAHQVTLTKRLESDRRAESLAPLVQLTHRSDVDVRECLIRRDRAARLAGLDDDLALAEDPVALFEARVSAAVDEVATLRALRPSGIELDRLLATAADTEHEAGTLMGDLAMAERSLADNTHLLDQLQSEQEVATAAQGELVSLTQRQHDVSDLLSSLDSHRETERILREATDHLATARSHTLSLKEEWLEIRELRLSGMAAEIASTLVVGGCCPVCGSADHPHLARARPQAPDARAERQARSTLDDAEAELVAIQARHQELTVQFTLLTDRVAGSSAASLRDEAAQLKRHIEQSSRVAARVDVIAAELVRAAQRQADLRAKEQQTRERLAHLHTVRAELEPLIARRRGEVEAALRGRQGTSIDQVLDHLQTELERHRSALAATRSWQAAAEAHQRNCAALSSAAAACGFVSSADAEAAIMSSTERAEAQQRVDDYDERVAKVDEILRSGPHLRAWEADEPDVAATQQQLSTTEDEATAAADLLNSARSRIDRAAELTQRLREALAQWQPVVEQLHLAIQVAALAEGTSPDNTLQMRLSGYVLAYRLEQVVAAANERLRDMSDQRYVLEHTARRGAGERRGGLSLLVRDDWSGDSRDPATLSGGETFVVSLALALGLADVIAHEVGGAELDTLFVDEGFGALDSETLDDVMDTLDALRAGGRVVGVVSHVSELRHRIPTRLHVTKRRSGSTLALVRGD